MPVKYDLLL